MSADPVRLLDGKTALVTGAAAELVAWLASDRAGFITGNYYAADGGYLAR